MSRRQQLGAFGERLAGRRIEAAGLAIIGRNVRTPSGEIDLVARDGGELVFIEVRTRRALPGTAAETIDAAKLRRMWQCAMEYCEADGSDPEMVRLDLVSIDIDQGGAVRHVEHFRGLEVPD